jgi:AcrR family transcriptional regulator
MDRTSLPRRKPGSARSGVAKMTLYKHYPSKEKLALAFLQRREELWTWGWLQGEVEQQARTPGEQLLTIFDVFDKWSVGPISRAARSSG